MWSSVVALEFAPRTEWVGGGRHPRDDAITQVHDFDDTAVAVFGGNAAIDDVIAELVAAGYDPEVIKGEEGRRHLDPGGEQGGAATLKRLLTAFGDQYRLLERLQEELDNGNVVVSVDATPDEATDAVVIMQDNGGEFIWKLGSWTYTQIEQ